MITERECGRGISCEEVCNVNVSLDDVDVGRESSKERDNGGSSCIAVIMDDNGDPEQAASDICSWVSQRYEDDPAFCEKETFLPPPPPPPQPPPPTTSTSDLTTATTIMTTNDCRPGPLQN